LAGRTLISLIFIGFALDWASVGQEDEQQVAQGQEEADAKEHKAEGEAFFYQSAYVFHVLFPLNEMMDR
jgi:hypothetical protein